VRVLHGSFGDQSVVLDIAKGQYVLLEPVASAMWRMIVDAVPWDAVPGSLAMVFDAPPARLAADFAAFHEQCRIRGWFEPGTDATAKVAGPVPSPLLSACRLLITVRRRLKRQGFDGAYEWAVERAPRVGGAPDAARLRGAERAFRRAEAIIPNPAAPDDCLPRSLALFAFLRRMGLPAHHRIGVEQMPFAAHAWVECGDRVVLDRDRRAELLVLSAV
jgi:hypothetical protein